MSHKIQASHDASDITTWKIIDSFYKEITFKDQDRTYTNIYRIIPYVSINDNIDYFQVECLYFGSDGTFKSLKDMDSHHLFTSIPEALTAVQNDIDNEIARFYNQYK